MPVGIDLANWVSLCMEPSLFTLFQRGRYFRLPERSDAESAEITRSRREAERFAAAAVGFCMKHHTAFRHAVLTEVCGVGSAKRKRCRIDVEPESWADLLIELGDNEVCVMEFKITAALQAHQNPACEDFLKSSIGYGARMEAAWPNARKRYVVLGCREWLGLPDKQKNWAFREVGWRTLSEVVDSIAQRSALIADLRDCLCSLGIWEFSSNMTKDMSFFPENGITAAAFAQLLWDVVTCPYLKLSTGIAAVRWESKWENRDRWRFGIELWPQADPDMGQVLRPRTQAPMAWIGYESVGQIKHARRAAWFYCDEVQTAEYVAGKLKPDKYSESKLLKRANEPTCVGIQLENDYHTRDQSNFIGVLARVQDFAKSYAQWQRDREEMPVKRRSRGKTRAAGRKR